jgi:hypothetical protein
VSQPGLPCGQRPEEVWITARRPAVLFIGGCPGGRAATSAYLGTLCRVAAGGGVRSRRSAAVSRLLLVAGTGVTWTADDIAFWLGGHAGSACEVSHVWHPCENRHGRLLRALLAEHGFSAATFP